MLLENVATGTHRLASIVVLGGVLLGGYSSIAVADVYFDTDVLLKDRTDALTDVLSSSVVPGGIRRVNINGIDMQVRRFANPAGDKSEFYSVWKAAEAAKLAANNRIQSVVSEHDPVLTALAGAPSIEYLEDNVDALLVDGIEFAKNQVELTKSRVIEALETPFTYETPRHRAIARIPVKAVDPDSPLATQNTDVAYLFLAEKKPKTTVSDAFWQIQFEDDFRFADLFSETGEDVQGAEPSISRYPNSRMTMAFTENANEWNSGSWSYESTGDVLSHVAHYIAAFEAVGFRKESNSVIESKQGLVQFSNLSNEATLFVELIEPLKHGIQVTLQIRAN